MGGPFFCATAGLSGVFESCTGVYLNGVRGVVPAFVDFLFDVQEACDNKHLSPVAQIISMRIHVTGGLTPCPIFSGSSIKVF